MSQPPISPVRVLVVQDHPLLASAIARVLESEEDVIVVGIARPGDEAATLAAEHNPSVVLMDFRLPYLSGPAPPATIRTAPPPPATLFPTPTESQHPSLPAPHP